MPDVAQTPDKQRQLGEGIAADKRATELPNEICFFSIATRWCKNHFCHRSHLLSSYARDLKKKRARCIAAACPLDYFLLGYGCGDTGYGILHQLLGGLALRVAGSQDLAQALGGAPVVGTYALQGGVVALLSQCGDGRCALHGLRLAHSNVGGSELTVIEALGLIVLVGDVVSQHHGNTDIGAVGVDADQLVTGEGSHLHLLTIQGVGGQLGGGVVIAPGLLRGFGVPSAGDGGAAAAVLDAGNDVRIRAGLEGGLGAHIQNCLRDIGAGSLVPVADGVDAVIGEGSLQAGTGVEAVNVPCIVQAHHKLLAGGHQPWPAGCPCS